MTCVGRVKRCIRNILINPYLKITILGVTFGLAISGLYSWMSHVDKVDLKPPIYKYNLFSRTKSPDDYFQEDGLHCETVSHHMKSEYCDNITQQMLNMTNANSAYPWQCGLYVDYSNKSLYDDIELFRVGFLSFLICTVLSSVYSMIHDCALIYHRNHMEKLISYCPAKTSILNLGDNIITPGVKIFSQRFSYCTLKSICMIFCQLLCVIPVIILFFLVATIEIFLVLLPLAWMMVFYQFYMLIIKCTLDGFIYVSSTWVGFSSGLMMMLAVLLLFASIGFDRSVPSIAPNECECYCSYMLIQKDLWSFIIVAFGLVLVNIRFLWSWYKESIHGEQFLYLLKYSLPLFVATNINRDNNPTGSMFGGVHISRNKMNVDDLTINSDNHEQLLLNNESKNVNTMTQAHPTFRRTWMKLTVLIAWEFLFGVLMFFATYNLYDYERWIASIIFAIGGVMGIGFIVVIIKSMYQVDIYKKYVLSEK